MLTGFNVHVKKPFSALRPGHRMVLCARFFCPVDKACLALFRQAGVIVMWCRSLDINRDKLTFTYKNYRLNGAASTRQWHSTRMTSFAGLCCRYCHVGCTVFGTTICFPSKKSAPGKTMLRGYTRGYRVNDGRILLRHHRVTLLWMRSSHGDYSDTCPVLFTHSTTEHGRQGWREQGLSRTSISS